MQEGFQVVFNSQGKNIISKTSINAVVYNINWASFLPQKYKKFKCQFSFISETYSGDLTNIGCVNINIGKTNIFDGQQMTNNIGVIYPNYNFGTGITSYYTASINDNPEFYCGYPVNSSVTVKLKTFAGINNMANMQDYILTILFIGIEE